MTTIPNSKINPKTLKLLALNMIPMVAFPTIVGASAQNQVEDLKRRSAMIMGSLGALSGGFTAAAFSDKKNRLRNALLGTGLGGAFGASMPYGAKHLKMGSINMNTMTKKAQFFRNNMVQHRAKTAGIPKGMQAFLGGALTGGAATPWLDPQMWNERTAIGDIPYSRIMMNALMGGAGALTGYDRFKMRGALGGTAAGVGTVKGLNLLRPEGEDTLSSLGRGALTGAQLSAIATLLASSGLRGGAVNNLVKRLFGGAGADIQPLAEGLSNLGTTLATPFKQVYSGIKEHSNPAHYLGDMSERFTKPGPIAKGFNYLFGSPSVKKLVGSGTIQDTKALPYIGANVKDFGLGLVAGVPTFGALGTLTDPVYREASRNMGIDPETGRYSPWIAYRHAWRKEPAVMAALHSMPAAVAAGTGKMIYDEFKGDKGKK